MMFVGFISSDILPLESLKKINGGNVRENSLCLFLVVPTGGIGRIYI